MIQAGDLACHLRAPSASPSPAVSGGVGGGGGGGLPSTSVE